MNNTYLDPWDGIGWTAAWAKVSERGEIEIREYFTYFEEGHSHNQWLLIFDNEHEAEAYVVATAYGPAPRHYEWAVGECLVSMSRDGLSSAVGSSSTRKSSRCSRILGRRVRAACSRLFEASSTGTTTSVSTCTTRQRASFASLSRHPFCRRR